MNLTSYVLLSCTAYGVPVPSISWSKNGTSLRSDSHINIMYQVVVEGGVTFGKSTLQICSTEFTDAGNFSCSAENGIKNDTARIELIVEDQRGTT